MSAPTQPPLQRFGFASPLATLVTASLFALLVVLTTETTRYVAVIDVERPEFREPPVDPALPKEDPDVRPPRLPPPVIGSEPLPIPPIPDNDRWEREKLVRGPTFQPTTPTDPHVTPLDSRDPIVVMPPRPDFPERARIQNVEGYAIVAFTVTAAGTIREAQIVEAQPAGWFEKAALSAANRLRYQPKLVEGKAVEAPGMMYKFVFDLEN